MKRALTLSLALLLGHAAQAGELGQALQGGKAFGDLRLRYEHVAQDGLEDADAPTFRARLGYETGVYEGFSALAEGEAIVGAGGAYNDGVNGHTGRALVNDPEDLAVNRLFLRYQGLPGTGVTLGRQAMALDNQRFVGYSRFRQNDLTLDGVAVNNTSLLPDTVLDYAYAYNVNRAQGNRSPIGDIGGRIHLLHATHHLAPWLDLSAYGYLLDMDDAFALPLSSQTYGLRASGSHKAGDVTLLYAAEAAQQSDYGSNPASYSEPYYLLEPGIAYGPVTVKLGYEVLGGNGAGAVQTPLASLHNFNGWADKFTTTPVGGLRDRYLDLAYAPGFHPLLKDSKLMLQLHDYRSDAGDLHYGREWGVGAEKTLPGGWLAGVAFADYQAEDFATDTQKTWVYLQYQF